ncbi:MAG: hypothetical protein ABIH78_00510 [Candidatus Peregrinibacteria bacterium]
MKNGISKNSLGLTLGIFLAAFHALWLLLIGLGVAKPALDWMLGVHHITLTWDVLAFDWAYAGLLVAMAFVAGYVIGWLFAGLWNLLRKN